MARAVRFDFLANDRDYQRGLSRMQHHTTRFGATIGNLAGVGVRAFGGLGVAAVGLGVAGAVMGVKTAAGLEQATIAFTKLLGSGKRAQAFLGQLKTFAAKTPFELPGLIDNARSLLGVGVAAKNVIPILTALGDASGALGLDQARFNNIMLATTQAMAKGKLQGDELLQFVENGIPVWNLLAKATGKPIPELQKLSSEGKLLSADVLPLLFGQMQKDYGGSMAKQSQTLTGLWSTFMDTLSLGLADAIKPVEDELKTGLVGATKLAGDALKTISGFISGTVVPSLETVKKWWDDNKRAVGLLASSLTTLLVPATDSTSGSVQTLGDRLAALRRALDRIALAFAYTQRALLYVELAFTEVEKGVENAGVAIGYAINLIDRLRGGSGHAADSIIRDFRKMRDEADAKLRNIRESLRKTQQAIDALHGKQIVINTLFTYTGKPAAGTNPPGPSRRLQHGTSSFPGGMALVGEAGPELALFPRGTQVIPHNRLGAAGGPIVLQLDIKIPVMVDQRQVGEASRQHIIQLDSHMGGPGRSLGIKVR